MLVYFGKFNKFLLSFVVCSLDHLGSPRIVTLTELFCIALDEHNVIHPVEHALDLVGPILDL